VTGIPVTFQAGSSTMAMLITCIYTIEKVLHVELIVEEVLLVKLVIAPFKFQSTIARIVEVEVPSLIVDNNFLGLL
jgi:hypothetical protein